MNPLRIVLIAIPTIVLSTAILSCIDSRLAGIPVIILLIGMLFIGIFGKFKNL